MQFSKVQKEGKLISTMCFFSSVCRSPAWPQTQRTGSTSPTISPRGSLCSLWRRAPQLGEQNACEQR